MATDDQAGPVTDTVTGPAQEAADIAAVLDRCRFNFCCETDLHEGIVQALYQAGIYIGPGQREVRLGVEDRIDFLLPSGLGIEVKIKGQTSAVWRQLRRYAVHNDRVRALLLVTTIARHAAGAPTDLDGVPVHTYVLRGAW